jgi:outer membrane lipoprotein-sorting protein
MKRILATTLLTLFVVASVSAITGREVAEKTENRETGETTHALVEMRLVDVGGDTKDRIIEQYGREQNDLTRSVIIFHRPASVEGTRFLTIERAGEDDDQWIYLPGLDRVRRIAGGEGDDSFMGTDFTYNDLEGRDIEEYTYELLGEETVGDWETYVVETIPKPQTDSQYSRLIQYVDKNSWIPVKIEFYDQENDLLKENRVHRMERVQGYWTIIENTMENVQTDHRTELQVTNFRYNEDLPDGLFTVNFLETGRP